MPKTKEILKCDKCLNTFHISCNFITNVDLLNKVKKVLCLMCRSDVSLTEGKKINETDQKAIKIFVSQLNKFESFSLCYKKSIKPNSVFCCNMIDQLQNFEFIFSKYKLSDLLKKSGTIYHALDKRVYSIKNVYKQFNMFTVSELLHLFLLVLYHFDEKNIIHSPPLLALVKKTESTIVSDGEDPFYN